MVLASVHAQIFLGQSTHDPASALRRDCSVTILTGIHEATSLRPIQSACCFRDQKGSLFLPLGLRRPLLEALQRTIPTVLSANRPERKNEVEKDGISSKFACVFGMQICLLIMKLKARKTENMVS